MRHDDATPEELTIAANGLSAIAITLCEMDMPDVEVRSAVLEQWRALHMPVSVLAAAATAVTHSPQPVLESAEKSERMEPIREMLRATSPHTQLSAMIRAREILQNLANEQM